MKHKIAVIVSALFMALTLTACGSGEPASAPSVADSDKAAVQEKLNKRDNKSDDTKADDEQSGESNSATHAETDTPTDSDGKNILVAFFPFAVRKYSPFSSAYIMSITQVTGRLYTPQKDTPHPSSHIR